MPPRTDLNALADEDFRQRWRAWIEAHYTSPLRDPLHRLTGDAARGWLRAQHRDGWRAPALPAEHGGMGLSLRKQLIYQQELERFGVARPMDMGLRLLAPVLLRYGTPAQVARYLPRILSGDDFWCQGYSEPNAGSDLANLRTEAVDRGSHFIVNGQKTWTTMADDSSMMFLLARTSREAKKQAGITFLVVPMSTRGIRVRPIRTLSGESHFCEVFLDDVAIPKDNVIGAIGDGWTVGKALLGFERFSHGSPELARHALKVLRESARALGLSRCERFRERLERLACDVADAQALFESVCSTAMAGGDAEDDFSMLKLFNAELAQRIADACVETAGPVGGLVGAAPAMDLVHDLEWLAMTTRPLTIFGGTAQLQRNLIATRTLELPRS
ncbi:acyl-CoA dehydrogenase family protein [Aquincola sp. MAHUQ-54]|uniref:Acyl-CoA dehydrogenase family protein n=1 Tax=Aquincola agrisoli TaxID=3119538 RepID=A0AAW9QPV7_9BURK